MTGRWTTGLLLSLGVASAVTAAPLADQHRVVAGSFNHPIILAQAGSPAAAARQELELWSKVRDSDNPADIESFLAAFPNGRLAPIARERLSSLRAKAEQRPAGPKEAAKPPDGPRAVIDPRTIIGDNPGSLPPQFRPKPSDSTQAASLTTGTIAEVQERLFSINYNPGPINGRMDKTTVAAITQFQNNHALPATGEIDDEFLKVLRDTRVPREWAALAFHGRGAFSAVWLRPSRRQAELDAMNDCKRRAGGTCALATAAGTQCIALANSEGGSRRRKKFQAYSYLAANLVDARGSVIEFCRGKSPYPDTCEVRATVCADGSHNR